MHAPRVPRCRCRRPRRTGRPGRAHDHRRPASIGRTAPGLILGAAACLTGDDPERIEALPHPTWPRRECLIQTAQKFSYDRAYRSAGATIVYADTREGMLGKLGQSTALIAGLSIAERQAVCAPPVNARR